MLDDEQERSSVQNGEERTMVSGGAARRKGRVNKINKKNKELLSGLGGSVQEFPRPGEGERGGLRRAPRGGVSLLRTSH